MRVYVIMYDSNTRRVGLNIKDSTLPENIAQYEGKVGLFGGGQEEGETFESAILRELEEEIPDFIQDGELRTLKMCLEKDGVAIFSVRTDLSGNRHNRINSRIGQLAALCQEGDGVVRSFDWVVREPVNSFVAPVLHEALLKLIAKEG